MDSMHSSLAIARSNSLRWRQSCDVCFVFTLLAVEMLPVHKFKSLCQMNIMRRGQMYVTIGSCVHILMQHHECSATIVRKRDSHESIRCSRHCMHCLVGNMMWRSLSYPLGLKCPRMKNPLHQTAFSNAPKSEGIVPASSGFNAVQNPHSWTI